MSQDTFLLLFFGLLGGGLPPLIWLWFWLKEDAHPEPKIIVAATFIGGMMTVPIALFLENLIDQKWPLSDILTGGGTKLIIILILIVSVEEIVKYGAARLVAFGNKSYNEPVDSIIYLISAALGFAGLENFLFLLNSLTSVPFFAVGEILLNSNITEVIIRNNLRFIGANVLHVVASGFLGVFIGLAFYKNRLIKFSYLLTGLFIAILLHTAFNYFIINFDRYPMAVFSGLWIFAIILILLFERVKRVRRKQFYISS